MISGEVDLPVYTLLFWYQSYLNDARLVFWVCFFCSVHLRVEEKISLTCGRDGGLQNMEVLGMVTLRVTDEKNGRIRLVINNSDNKGLQLQVGPLHIPVASRTGAGSEDTAGT